MLLTLLLAAAMGGFASWVLMWFYDEDVPSLATIREDLYFIRSILRIRRSGQWALEQLLTEARRRPQRR